MASFEPVRAWTESIDLPTYLPERPDPNPMFLEKRVYQGSSGRVYPLPFTDRIAPRPAPRRWKAVWIENEFLRVLILPEIGGRIHRIQDKTNQYDLIYHQPVIKPALVGLAGPWISGGIELNWPQHHRPATFLPVDVHLESHPDGSKTAWCSDHDPMTRMKGMHGVCLRPGAACVELKARAYNRTPFAQTFLWWANAAARAHEGYQSFFPPDVAHVADHARRATSEYPLCRGRYYGVDYGARAKRGVPPHERPAQFIPPHCRPPGERPAPSVLPPYAPNDLSFYANIPVPTSYMALGSREDFCGGYDYVAQAGVVHLANHHIAPGKKQWTWGNHDFGYAWDRNLTDADARGQRPPYIEIMAGVYTDNQPDFSFLHPGETKTWSQYWYPIQKIGPVRHANLDAALNFEIGKQRVRIGVCVTRAFPDARIRIENGRASAEWRANLAPGKPFVLEVAPGRKPWTFGATTLRVLDRDGREIIGYTPKPPSRGAIPPPATAPPPPREITSADELYLAGLHLDQYRHATRSPALYWLEALRRDPMDSRCNNAMGLWRMRRGEFLDAEKYFRNAIARLTARNPNPYDGEAHYNLGLCLRFQLDALPPETMRAGNTPGAAAGAEAGRLFDESRAAFFKATWNQAWAAPAYHAIAELDCRRRRWDAALDCLERSLRLNADNTRARNLKAIVLRQLRRGAEADNLLRETLALDPLDWWARCLIRLPLRCDAQTRLDLAHDFARAGFYPPAIGLLKNAAPKHAPPEALRRRADAVASSALPDQSWGAAPLIHYTVGWLFQKSAESNRLASPSPPMPPAVPPPDPLLQAARDSFRRAAAAPPDYCFPSRLEEIAVLEAARRANSRDPRAPYYLGNLLYDRRRHREAIQLWNESAKLAPAYSVVWRNLGIGAFNILKNPRQACAAYDKALRANPRDARLLFERDQLWKRLGVAPEKRLRQLERRLDLVRQRDDLSVELCELYNSAGQPAKALEFLGARQFQPWEGGEGGPLAQHVRARVALGRAALKRQDFAAARDHFQQALASPENLGEAKHLLANQSDIHYWLGLAHAGLGDATAAEHCWTAAASFQGDFQEMRARLFSERTYFSALAWRQLGQRAKAQGLLRELLGFARKLEKTPATIDYFATSLPAMLLFEDDRQARQQTTALFLQAQAYLGLGKTAAARRRLRAVLARDPNHAWAAEFSSAL